MQASSSLAVVTVHGLVSSLYSGVPLVSQCGMVKINLLAELLTFQQTLQPSTFLLSAAD